MKKIFFYTSFCFLLLISSGCNKFLEKEPDNRAKLDSPEKISELLGTAYPQANYQPFAETMSDNVADIGSGGTDNTIHDPYFFIDTRENQQDSPEFYWYACYAAIASANQALETISKVTSDLDAYSAQKAEALVARAYAHFMLVNFFSKFYDPATASTDPGIPYVTEPETVFIKQYDRKTVQYDYDMIEKDLLEGLPFIQDKNYTIPKYHFNRAAANAFAARFYLYKKDYDKVIYYTSQAIPGNNFVPVLRPWNTTYKNITDVTELFKIYAKATEPANLLLVETSSVMGTQLLYEPLWRGPGKTNGNNSKTRSDNRRKFCIRIVFYQRRNSCARAKNKRVFCEGFCKRKHRNPLCYGSAFYNGRSII